MTTTGLPRATATDLARVGECLQMLAPRWSVWTLMTLEKTPLRYATIKAQLPWLGDGQLHPRLHALTDEGLLQRGQLNQRHVTYGLTDRGTSLIDVLEVIADWGSTHLEKDSVLDPATGQYELERIPRAQDAEDTLGLISPRHATPLLWALRIRGEASARTLASLVMPHSGPTGIYYPLRQLTDDGLIQRTARDAPCYQLTQAGASLAPLYTALSTWAVGKLPTTTGKPHPVWGRQPAAARRQHAAWATHQPRTAASLAPAAPAPAPTAEAAPAWRPHDLFSHRQPVRPAAPATTGRRR
ncbi:hypothetical protein AN219_37455 [Streptomyces nanshensis]|nr:hypothetical protein AN219_37455 [Streptomyces nanshensis]